MSQPAVSPPVPATPILEAAGLCRSYGAQRVVDGVDLRVARGEIVALMGSNGAGKSTLLGLLAGEILPDQGQVLVAGTDLAVEPEKARARLIHVPQQPPLAPFLSLREHAGILAGLRGLDVAASERDLSALAEAFALSPALGRPVRVLSGGMAHKAALCLGFLAGTPLVLLDEPHAGLDLGSGLALRGLIEERARAGTGFVIATHESAAALALAHRVVVLAAGRVAAVLGPADLAALAGRTADFEAAVLRAMRAPAP
jgi:ABC-2 type transport system ATP-binding protein